MKPIVFSSLALAVLALGACKPTPAPAPSAPATDAGVPTATPVADSTAPAVSEPVAPAPADQAADVGTATDPAQQAMLNGFGDMKLGSSAAEAKAAWGGELKSLGNEADVCHYLVPRWAEDSKSLAFMIENDRFVRYDVGNDKETAPGGGKVGMSASDLQKLYRNALKASSHKYVEGAQYLALDASGVAPSRLVFETDAKGTVIAWHVGLSPQADYVEGCS